MTRRFLTTAALLLLAAPAAVAQPVPPVGPNRRPAVSPYLGLAIGGNPGINYLSLVRPQQQFQQQVNQLQQQYQQAANGYGQDGLALGADPFLPLTGVVGRFNNTGTYFSRHPVTGTGGVSINRGGFGGSSGYGGFGGGSAFGGGFGGAGLSNQRFMAAPTGGVGGGRTSSVPRR